MITFIANRIEDAGSRSIEEGQAKYRAYFISTNLYLKQKPQVDAILIQDGYEDCIVTQ